MKRAAVLTISVAIMCLVGAMGAGPSMAASDLTRTIVHPMTTSPVAPRGVDPPRFLFLGDSLTAGLFASEEASTFRALLTAHFGATATRVTSLGGDSADFLASEAAIIAAQPDVAIVELGTNDEVDGRYTPDDLAANLRSLVGFAREGNPSCRVVMLSTWRGTGKYPKWDAAIEGVADDCGASFVSLQVLYDNGDYRGPAGLPTIWPGIPGPGGIGWVTDRFHPNDAGHSAIATAVRLVLEDQTAPQTTDDAPSRWQAHDTIVTLTAWDGGSGVDHVEYKVDDGAWIEGYQAIVPAPANHSNDGVHVVSYRAVDVALNTETEKVCQVNVDTRRPATRAPCRATVTSGCYVKLRYRVNDARPNGGTASVTIRIKTLGGKTVRKVVLDRGPVNTPRAWRFRCNLARGIYNFYVSAIDSAGNVQSRTGSNRLVVR